jgi:small subunit ribosomal protein S4
MKLGPKYKIARRLGAEVFEKTQSPKFVLSEQKRKDKRGYKRPPSVYGQQLLAKQKVRIMYGLSEKQFSNYVKKAIESKGNNAPEILYQLLESRLDSVILRSGFATTRQQARQIASHGHMKVNGTRTNVPSYQIKEGDVVSVKESSQDKAIFQDLEQQIKDITVSSWIVPDAKAKSLTIKGEIVYDGDNLPFDLQTVIQFYKR